MGNSQANDWYGTDVATFGDRLAAAREAAGMSQEVFAKRVGVKLATLQKWENDLAEPRANRLSMMAGIVGVSMTWLMTGTGEGVTPDMPQEDPDLNEVLSELRSLRTELTARAEHIGRIEKRLRAMRREDALV